MVVEMDAADGEMDVIDDSVILEEDEDQQDEADEVSADQRFSLLPTKLTQPDSAAALLTSILAC